MGIRVFDTLRRKKVELVPLVEGKVGLYACGPTTYNFIHLGNARPIIAFDVVTRHLRARGFTVTYVRNITDVDDKIIKRAAELGEDFGALTRRFTDEFHKDIGALACLAPDHEPRVTQSIPEIVAIVEKLVARGVAYEAEGDVYFAVAKFPPYGELSHQPLDDLQVGARVEASEKKRDPLDFALWKAAKPGEPSWDSPWGKGRPGWHIECSAMSQKWLGASFDLHGGGIDLVFPHHENERAQSQGANGEGTYAAAWLHNGFINFNGAKISKSDEDQRRVFDAAFKLRSLLARHGGEAVRFFVLTTHYRNPISHEVVVDPTSEDGLRFPALEEAERRVEYGYLTKQRLVDALAAGKPSDAAPAGEPWLEKIREALDDDFNTAEALAAWGEGLAWANRVLDGKVELAKDVKRATLQRAAEDLSAAGVELGLLEAPADAWLAEHRARRAAARKIDVAHVEQQIVARAEARKAKDFSKADAIREALTVGGVEIMDTPRGTTWRVAD